MLERMFTDVGAKIKKCAKTLFVIESIAAIIGGLVYFMEEEEFAIMLLIILGGIGVAYIGALFLAAFGELVQTNTDTKRNTDEILKKLGGSCE